MFTSLIDTSQVADFAKGKELVADCQKIVSMYITGGKSDNWYNQLVRALSGASNTYDHASSVSTLAALLSIGLELPNPEDVAMAGFLHDLGRASTPEELINTPLANWPEDLRTAYLNHPVESMNVIKTKKMVVPKEVERAILQHHEMYNGKGFPKQIAGDRISVEAQVLSLADQFFYLTVETEGKKRLSPREAFAAIKANESISPILLKKLEPIITGEDSSPSASARTA
jgi:putative nucleotidyltransferase with HDIG domain